MDLCPGLRLTYTLEFLRDILIHVPGCVFTWNYGLARNEKPFVDSTEKKQAQFMDSKGKIGSIYFFHGEEFCSNKVQLQSPPTPFTSFLASKVCSDSLSPCNNTDISDL